MKRFVLLFLVLFSIFIDIEAQDPQFSQYYTVPLYLGPSFAGTTKGSRININYRNQWPALPKAFTTIAVSYDHYFYKFRSGVGLFFLRDRAGEGRLGITTAAAQYSFDVHLDRKWRLRPGVLFAYTQRSIDYSALEVPSGSLGSSSTYRVPNENVLAFDFSTSLVAYNANTWFGFTLDHLTQPNLSLYSDEEYKLGMKFSLYGGTTITRRGRLIRTLSETLNPSFIFKMQPNDVLIDSLTNKKKNKFHYQMDIGGYWYKNPLMFGVWFRGFPYYKVGEELKIFSRDALVFMAGYKIDELSIGYSFDATISNLLVTKTFGSHEISIVYKFNQEWERMKRPKRKPLPCPTF